MVISGGNGAIDLEVSEDALDAITLPVEALVVPDHSLPVRLRRDAEPARCYEHVIASEESQQAAALPVEKRWKKTRNVSKPLKSATSAYLHEEPSCDPNEDNQPSVKGSRSYPPKKPNS